MGADIEERGHLKAGICEPVESQKETLGWAEGLLLHRGKGLGD